MSNIFSDGRTCSVRMPGKIPAPRNLATRGGKRSVKFNATARLVQAAGFPCQLSWRNVGVSEITTGCSRIPAGRLPANKKSGGLSG